MFKSNKDKVDKPLAALSTFTLRQGLAVIWRLLAYGLAFDVLMFLMAIPIILITLIFAPDKLLNALVIIKGK